MELFKLQDVQLDDLTLKQQYYQALATGNVNAAREIYNNNSQLHGKAVTADMLNQIVDAVVDMETLYYDNVEDVLEENRQEFQLKIDNMVQMGDFNATIQYNIGNFVIYSGDLYFCTHKPTIGTLPTDTSYWLKLGLKGLKGNPSLGVNYVGAWNSGTTYEAKQMVVYQQDLFVAKQTGQAQNPVTSPDYWFRAVDIVPLMMLVSETEPLGIQTGLIWVKILT